MSGFLAVGYFLVTLFFGILLLVLWTRMALRYFKVSALHPVSQAINTFADPLIRPIDSLFLSKKQLSQRFDLACFILILIVEILKFIILGVLLYGAMLPLSYLFLFVVTDLLVQPCNLLFYIILIRVVMSWINPNWHNPVADVMKTMSDPALALGRHIIPDISGFDFSPFIILIILKVITLFMSASMPLRLL